MDSNDAKQLQQSVINNKALITDIDESFFVFANSVSYNLSDSADDDLKELINLVEK